MKRIVLGITGGIATGKSTVLKRFKSRGAAVLSSDQLAHDSLRRGRPAYKKVVLRWGASILNPDKTINRKRLGDIIFADQKARVWLEHQIHPYVIAGIKRHIQRHSGIIAIDIPLLFEAGLENLSDMNIVVFSTQKQQIARLKSRNRLSRSEALLRIRAQLPMGIKRRKADRIIDNSRSRVHSRRQVDKLWKELKNA